MIDAFLFLWWHFWHRLDEELGGDTGLRIFVKTDAFKRMNVGFSLGNYQDFFRSYKLKEKSLKFFEILDEGIASPNEDFPVFYAERSRSKFAITNILYSELCQLQIYNFVNSRHLESWICLWRNDRAWFFATWKYSWRKITSYSRPHDGLSHWTGGKIEKQSGIVNRRCDNS